MTASEPSSQEGHSATESLLQQYSTPSGMFDEMESSPATPRPHWSALMESLQRLGRHELAARWENGRRIIREHGVTYNVYGDPQGMNRPWGLDLVPMLITGEEWARVEAGLIQRSRLFNLILADIYSGSQRLLRDGFLPPELIYANPGFLRPCRGIAIPSQARGLHASPQRHGLRLGEPHRHFAHPSGRDSHGQRAAVGRFLPARTGDALQSCATRAR
jgi:uncharacterized circularly permuted ATP-grasp superfamily protein